MILDWLRPNRIAALHVRIKPMFEALRSKLNDVGVRHERADADDRQLLALVSDALALVDFNFSVLRDSGGDLQEYALLLISLRLYHLLWPNSNIPPPRPSQPRSPSSTPR